MGSLSNTSAFEAFDRMPKVEMIEAEADAARELDDLAKDTSLEKQFKALNPLAKGDLLLESLKRRSLQ
jgi:phage shock protein A